MSIIKNSKLVISNTLGIFLEYFDATLYGFFAPIIAHVFFPKENPQLMLLMAWGAFSITFFARPIGAIALGHLADKISRQKTLSLTILIMSFSTTLIGFIPSYQQIGYLSPLLLVICRFIQGFSLSSEYSGGSVYLIESFKKNKGLLSGITTSAGSFGIFVASLLATLFVNSANFSSKESAWRFVFIFSGIVIGILGYYLRSQMPETPIFLQLTEKKQVLKIPFFALVKFAKAKLIMGIIVSAYVGVAIYTIMVYSASYLKTTIGLDAKTALLISSITSFVEASFAIFFGFISDFIGSQRVLIFATAAMTFFVIPLFFIIYTKTLSWIIISLLVAAILIAAFDGPLAAWLIEMFEPQFRNTGVSLCYNLGAGVIGGITPFLISFFMWQTKLNLLPGFYVICFAVIALIALISKRNRKQIVVSTYSNS